MKRCDECRRIIWPWQTALYDGNADYLHHWCDDRRERQYRHIRQLVIRMMRLDEPGIRVQQQWIRENLLDKL